MGSSGAQPAPLSMLVPLKVRRTWQFASGMGAIANLLADRKRPDAKALLRG